MKHARGEPHEVVATPRRPTRAAESDEAGDASWGSEDGRSAAASPSRPAPGVPDRDWSEVVLGWFALAAPAVVVALVVVPFVSAGGTVLPWAPTTPELTRLIHLGHELAAGRPAIGPQVVNGLEYSPAGALLVALFSLVTPLWWQVVLTVLSSVALVDVVRRTSGWSSGRVMLASVAAVGLVEPVRTALGVGQVSILLLWLVVADLGPRGAGAVGAARMRRPVRLPAGALTGLAGAFWLPLLWLVPALAAVGRRRAAMAATVSAFAATFVGWLVMPGQSETLWDSWAGQSSSGVVRTQPGGPADPLATANLSVGAALERLGMGQGTAWATGMVLAAVVVGLAGVLRRVDPVLALGLVLVAAQGSARLAWTWHLVAVVVVAIGLWRARDRLVELGGWGRLALVLGVLWACLVGLGPAQVLVEPHTPADGSTTAQQVAGGVGWLAFVGVLVGVTVGRLVASEASTTDRRS